MTKEITSTILERRREWKRRWGLTPKRINYGGCFDFAKQIFDVTVGAKICGQNIFNQGHTYIEFEGLYYDAETPEGVSKWEDLPFFLRVTKKFKPGAL